MFKLRRLEDRIVLDGAGVTDALGEVNDHEVHDSMMHDYAQNGQDIQDGDYGIDGHEPLYTADGADSTPGGGGVNVLVISSDINDADDLANAAKDGVIVVRYDASGTTMEDLSGLIRDTLDGREAETMAFAAHDVELVTSPGNADQQAFWQAVGDMLSEEGRIDLLACNVIGDQAGQAFVAKIEELSGADVAASADPTGNEAYGGDWVLESDGIDIQSTYFDAEKLEGFDGVLQNTAPVITTNKPLDISAEESSVIDEGFLLATDPDSADWAGALKYTLLTVPYNGSLFFDTDGNGEINGNETALKAGDTFTQAQVYTDDLTYLHDGANNTVETFKFNVTDSAGLTTGDKTFTINVTQNVNPVIVVNKGMTVDENGSGVVADLKVEDRDETSDNLEYTLVTIPTHGTLWFDLDKDGVIDDGESKIGIPGEGESSFTQSQIDEGIIAYKHNGKFQGPLLDGFSFTVKDDKTAGSVNGVFRITVDEVNDAPAKMQVGEITALDKPVNITSSHLNFTDADNSPYYLTYTLETLPEHGELYLIDPGEDGILNTYDDTISYLGKGNTFTQTNINFGRLYFDRSSANSYDDIQDSFTFKVSDPDGTHAENQDDGTDIFTFDITVGDLNEAPYLFLNDDAVINEDSSGKIETLQTRDPDKNDGPENLTYRITELGEDIDKDGIIDIPFYGTLFIDANNSGSLDEGEKWLDNDSDKSIFTFTQEDIDNGKLVYTYDSSVGDYGRTQLKFEVYDDGDTDGSVDEFGDKWAQSAGGTLVIRIFNENDAPVLDRNELLIMDEPVKEGDETAAVIDTSVLNFTDIDNSPGGLTYKVGTATTVGTLYLGDEALIAGSTFTQADIDSGKLKYEFDYANNEPKDDGTDDSFTFTVEDAGTIDDPETEFAVNETDDTTTFTFNIEVNNQNDLPVLENNTLNIETFQRYTAIGPGSLEITDIDEDDPSKLKFTLSSNWMSPGRLFFDGGDNPNGEYHSSTDTIIESAGQSFTQEDINEGRVMYDSQLSTQPDASRYASFNFTYTDGNPGAQQPDQGFETFNIKVYGTNSLPTYTQISVPEVIEGNAMNLRPYIKLDDVETIVTELVYTITTLPTHGELQLKIDEDFVTIEQGDTFTHLQVLGNDFRYKSTSNIGADGDVTEDLFKFELRDSDNETTKNETETFNININGVFSNPELDVDNMEPMKMNEDETEMITSDNLMAYDPDYEEENENYYGVTYTLTGKSSSQSFLFIDNNNDKAWDDNDTKIYVNAVDGETQFKQTDINEGKLYYYNYSEPPSEDTDIFSETFSFTIEDTDTPNIDEYTLNIDVTANEKDIPMPAPDTSRNITGVYEGGKKFVEYTDIMFTDGETEDQDTLKYTLVDAPDYGDLYFDEDIPRKVNAGDSFSLSELTGDERMYYQHNGAEGSSDIFTIKVTNLTGQSNSADINVGVISLNDAPVLDQSEMTVTEGETENLRDEEDETKIFLRVTDADNTDSELTYKITSSLETDPDPQNSKETFNGVLKLGDEVLALDSEFTQQDINDGKLSYSHDGTEDPLETFTFTVTDSAGDETEEITGEFKINITSVNDGPKIENKGPITVAENEEKVVIDHNFLLTNDPDSPKSELVYEIDTAPLGTLQYSAGDTLRVISKDGSTESTFTQAELSSGNILYIPNGDEADDSFTFTVTDGFAQDAGEFIIHITPMNDAPVVVNNSITVVEDSANHIDEHALMATDEENFDQPENVTFKLDTVPTYGFLFFDDGDGEWNNETKLVAGDTFTQEDINEHTNGRLTFQHINKGLDVDQDSFKFQVADDSDGILTDQTFTINVTNVNDAPVVTSKGLTVWEGEGIGMEGRSGVIDGTKLDAFDGDDSPDSLTYEVTGLGDGTNPFSGKLFFDNNGNRVFDSEYDSLIGVGDKFTQTDINKGSLTFEHNGDDDLKETFEFIVRDDGLDTDLETVIPVKEASGVFEINVFGVNDSPELTGPFSSSDVVDAVGGEVLSFNGVGAELISIDDPDAGFGKMTVVIDLKSVTVDGEEISAGKISASMNIEGTEVVKTSSLITIEGSRDDVNTVLSTLTFTPNSDYSGEVFIAFEVRDNGNTGEGGSGHDSGTIKIDVTEGEPAPPEATDSVASAAEDMIYTFQAEDFSFNESVAGIFVIPDTDAGELQLFNADDEWVTIEDPTQDPITIAQINAGRLRFTPTANENGSEYSQFQYRVYNDLSDGTRVYAETANIMTINVMPINDKPENIVPGTQLVKVDTSLEFSGNNQIRIKDIDSTGDNQQLDPEIEFTVQLQVGSGILNGLDGMDATVDGNGTNIVTITGTLNEVNTELSGLTYDAKTLGADTLTILTDDGGNYGGIPLQDQDIVLITITDSDPSGGDTFPEDGVRMNSNSPFTYQFDEFAADFPADRYEVTGKPDWLVFKEESRTFYYVKDITGTAVSGTYEIEVTAYYDQSGTAITDTLTIEVAGLNKGVVNALRMLDDTQDIILDNSETMEIQEVMMAKAPAATGNTVNIEMLEALKLIESDSFSMMA